MNEKDPPAALISALTTEHYVLQSAISANTSEVGTAAGAASHGRMEATAPIHRRAAHGVSGDQPGRGGDRSAADAYLTFAQVDAALAGLSLAIAGLVWWLLGQGNGKPR